MNTEGVGLPFMASPQMLQMEGKFWEMGGGREKKLAAEKAGDSGKLEEKHFEYVRFYYQDCKQVLEKVQDFSEKSLKDKDILHQDGVGGVFIHLLSKLIMISLLFLQKINLQ